MSIFKEGDKVRCINNDGCDLIRKGRVYEVVSIDSTAKSLFISYKGEFIGGYFSYRFEKVVETIPSWSGKTQKEMTAREFLDFIEYSLNNPVEFRHVDRNDVWSTMKIKTAFNRIGWAHQYRVKTSNPNASEIAEIESQMRVLADRLSKLK